MTLPASIYTASLTCFTGLLNAKGARIVAILGLSAAASLAFTLPPLPITPISQSLPIKAPHKDHVAAYNRGSEG